jgi:hypothetical protein
LLKSVPSGATVWSGATRVGETPLEVTLKPGQTTSYRFTLSGHLPAEQDISAEDTTREIHLSRRPAKVDELKENPFK